MKRFGLEFWKDILKLFIVRSNDKSKESMGTKTVNKRFTYSSMSLFWELRSLYGYSDICMS